MMLSNVVLPQPLAPTRQTNSPSVTFRLTRSSARTAPDAPLKLFETFSIASFEGAMSSSSSAAEEWWRRAMCIYGISISFDVSVDPFKKPASFPSCTDFAIKSRDTSLVN